MKNMMKNKSAYWYLREFLYRRIPNKKILTTDIC